jgi:hypothetical protein
MIMSNGRLGRSVDGEPRFPVKVEHEAELIKVEETLADKRRANLAKARAAKAARKVRSA